MTDFIHYLSIIFLVLFPSLGVVIGQSRIAKNLINMIDEQPAADGALKRCALVSLTLIETAGILAIIMGLLLLFDTTLVSPDNIWGHLGLVCAIGVPGFMVGYFSSIPGVVALKATARQPFDGAKILQLLLISQTIMQTPIIFGFIIALLMRGQIVDVKTAAEGVKLFASGLVMALGSIGPTIGLSQFSKKTIIISGLEPEVYPQLRTFSFVSQALIEAQVIFSLLVAIVLLMSQNIEAEILSIAIFLAAALGMGLSTFVAGISSSKIASSVSKNIALTPKLYPIISRSGVIAQTFIDTAVVYATIIALIILLVR